MQIRAAIYWCRPQYSTSPSAWLQEQTASGFHTALPVASPGKISPPPACLGAPDDWGPFLALVSSQKCGLGEPRAAAAGAAVPVGEDPVHWHCVVEELLEDPLGMDTEGSSCWDRREPCLAFGYITKPGSIYYFF